MVGVIGVSVGSVEDVASELVERVLAKVLREERTRAEQERKGEGEKVCGYECVVLCICSGRESVCNRSL